MGWETRNGRAYYYRKHRIDGRVVSEYVGRDAVAELVAAQDARQRAEREEERAKRREKRRRQDELDAKVDDACAAVRAALAGTMQAAGFHRHKGQWRKKHGESLS